jgi:CubicO group peptidase (beta-lactamase class C family)
MRLISFVLIVMCLGLARTGRAQPAVTQKLAAYMDGQQRINHFAGVVLITRHDSVLLHQAYGLADAEWNVANTLDTKFAIASITKQFTAVAVLQLAERGQLQLTDVLEKFVPGLPNGNTITVHQLLTHTSGLSLDFEELYVDRLDVSKDSALAFMRRQPVQFAPGARVGYSNTGYFLLGQIIEKASGLAYGSYLQRHILDVAGMGSTGLHRNGALVPGLARLYCREGDSLVKNPAINWNLNLGHDGLYSTAGDLARFALALRGTTLLSEASKALMNTPHTRQYPGRGFWNRYGYGVFIDPYYSHGHHLLTHSGGYFGAMTSLDRYPGDDALVVVLSNNQAESQWISYGLGGILFGKPVELPYVHQPAPNTPAVLPTYAGTYAGRGGDTRILFANGQLYLDDLESQLVAEADRKFFSRTVPDRTVEFLLSPVGRVRGIVFTKGGVPEVQLKAKAPAAAKVRVK